MQTCEELLAENAALKVENATLKARVAELEADVPPVLLTCIRSPRARP